MVETTGNQAGAMTNLWLTARIFWPFGLVGDLDPRRNLPGASALNLWLAIPFFIGLIVALRRLKHPAYSLLIVSLAGLLLPGVFSEYAPHFHRVLGAAGPAAILIGLGLATLGDRIAAVLRQRLIPRQLVEVGVPLLLLTLATLVTVRDYFQRWAALPDLYYAFDVGLWEMGQWIGEQPTTTSIYLSPRRADHPTLAFASKIANRPAPVSFDGRHIFPLTAAAATAPTSYAIIEHEDFRTRLLLPGVFPDAVVTQEWRDSKGEVFGRVYTRPVGSMPSRPPRHPRQATVGDGIDLVGYDTFPDVLRPGDILYLQLHWQNNARTSNNWTVFTHLLGPAKPNGDILWAGYDSIPGGGSLPTTVWQPGWRILDEYQISLPADLPPGEYQLAVGLYQPDGRRLPATDAGLIIGEVAIEPAIPSSP